MRRFELLLAGAALSAVAFVAAAAIQQRQHAGGAAAARVATDAADDADGVDPDAPVATQSGAPADAPDPAEVRRRIAAAGETWMGDLLADGDSTLVRWPDHLGEALRVWIDRSPGLVDWDPRYPAMAEGVFDEWRTAGFPMRFTFVSDFATADLRITWVKDFPEPRQLGFTLRTTRNSGWIAAAQVAIATKDEDGRPLSPDLVRATVRHEVGHALGLNHVGDSSSVMFPRARTLEIGARDRATLRLLYSLPAGSVR